MAHFAHIVDGIVDQVIVAEPDFIQLLPDPDQWVQTSYNTRGGVHLQGGTPLRKNYAGVGYTYDQGRDAFIPPHPSFEGDPAWELNEETCLWEPIADPE